MEIPKNTEKYLAHNIKYLRRLHKLTQEEFAAIIGKKKSVIGFYEAGTGEPDINSLILISKKFGITIEDLLLKNLGHQANETDQALSIAYKTKDKNEPSAETDERLLIKQMIEQSAMMVARYEKIVRDLEEEKERSKQKKEPDK